LSKPEKKVAGRRNLWIVLALVVIVIIAVVSAVWILVSLISPLGGYKAEDTESYSDEVTVDDVYLEREIFNGPIQVSTWNNAEQKNRLNNRSQRLLTRLITMSRIS